MPSTVIRRFSYRPRRRELLVEFTTGRLYVYSRVPESEVRSFEAAFSKGRYFNSNIRNRYDCHEVANS